MTKVPSPQPASSNNPLPPQVRAAVRTEVYSGPVPPPDLLRQYDEIDPGRARKLLDLAEDQTRHRMYLEKRVVNSDVVRSWAGLGAGLVVALANLGAAVWLVMNGHDWAGAALASTSLGGLVGVFIYGTNSARRERIEKEKIKLGRK